MDRRSFVRYSVAAAVAASLPYGRSWGVQIAGDVAAVRSSGGATTLAASDLQQLKASLRGALLLAGDPGYDTARRVRNQSIDKHPALIVQPTGVSDVRTAVDFARAKDLLLAVKCGGHSYSGRSTCEGGLQLDLSTFRGVRVDPAARTAYVSGGSLLGEIDHEAMSLGMVTTAGTVSHTGVGGLTLGAGFGRVARRFGLALDNVKAVDIVSADGQLRHASRNENPDLHWAVRGGGGNFGVVTSFEFDLHPMQREVVGGRLIFPIDRARELLQAYAEICQAAPDDLYIDAIMSTARGGNPGMFLFDTCYSGPAARAEAAFAPLRKLGTPLKDTIGAIDYVALQRSGDTTDPRVEGSYLKSGFIDAFPGKLVQAILDGYTPDPARTTTVFFQHAGGAIGKVAASATAFPHRRAVNNMFATVAWPLGDEAKAHVDYVKAYWKSLESYTDGYYTNEVANEAQSVVDDNYQGNLARLRQIKKKYDPGNLFRLNANILPA
ncbi:MAG TPA: FAD-binding oxidoreductase [Steroidobacteraceae bacterium]